MQKLSSGCRGYSGWRLWQRVGRPLGELGDPRHGHIDPPQPLSRPHTSDHGRDSAAGHLNGHVAFVRDPGLASVPNHYHSGRGHGPDPAGSR